jgi:hypothetical protein
MSEENPKAWLLLDPQTLIGETLFGLIMVLTFTGSLSVADAGRDDVRAMLIGALGCNIAWGVIDAIFYLMNIVGGQGLGIRALRKVRQAREPGEARQVIAAALPPIVAATLSPADYDSIHAKLLQNSTQARPRLSKNDLLGALSVFLLVFITTFPVAIPFIFMDQLGRAMRTSNAIAIAMLFIVGFAFGRISQIPPWLTGIAMVVCGSLVVAATIALGG